MVLSADNIFSFAAATVMPLIITILYVTDLILLVPKYNKCKYDHTPRRKKLMWKGACIGVPFLLLVIGTIINSIYRFDYRDLLIVAGMLLCAVGDIVIEIRFFKGGLCFAAGHIFYVTAFFLLNNMQFNVTALIVYIILAGCGTFLTIQMLGKKYRPFLIGYNLVISGTFALALPLILTGRACFVFLGTGACFLAVSDWLLARNKAFKSTYGWSLLSLMFYFGGQILISAYPWIK